MIYQQTLIQPFSLSGIGIHTGQFGKVTVSPAAPGTGRVFLINGHTIPARADFIVDTRRCTALGDNNVRIYTVEHLMSALFASGVDNAIIELEGPEIPIFDGSALPFIQAIQEAGVETQNSPVRILRLFSGLVIDEGESHIEVEPADQFDVTVDVDFSNWPEGNTQIGIAFQEGNDDNLNRQYIDRVAPARTFAFRQEVEQLLAAGLAKGGSLDNALIITPPDSFSTPLRLPTEWAVHKLLDVIGDLALVDVRLQMKVHIKRPGHWINAKLAQKLLMTSLEEWRS